MIYDVLCATLPDGAQRWILEEKYLTGGLQLPVPRPGQGGGGLFFVGTGREGGGQRISQWDGKMGTHFQHQRKAELSARES